LLLSYLDYSKIWLNYHMDDHHSPTLQIEKINPFPCFVELAKSQRRYELCLTSLLIGLGRVSHHWPSKAPLQAPSEKSRFGCLNYLSHPHLRVPFLKSVELFLCNFNSPSSAIVWRWSSAGFACIIFMYSTSATSTSFCRTLALPLFRDCVMLYKWLHNDVIGTPKFGL
jgi:hypothetical protein